MTTNARRVWHHLEPLNAVVYFAPEVHRAADDLGLKGFWMGYFAFRSAPLGPAGADLVTATFGGFHPDRVGRAIPEAWTRATPEQCVAARSSASAAVLRAAGVDVQACGAAVALLAPVVADADCTGRPLGAANRAVPLSDDPVEAIWQVASTVREHRGDGHIAALVAAGIDGCEMHLIQAASGAIPGEVLRTTRMWSEDEWAAATDRLRSRGLIEGDPPLLTESGHALRREVEDRTDELSWRGALAPLGDGGVTELKRLLRPSVDAVQRAAILPFPNPMGLPPDD